MKTLEPWEAAFLIRFKRKLLTFHSKLQSRSICSNVIVIQLFLNIAGKGSAR